MPLPDITVPSFPQFNPPVSSGHFLSDSTPSSSSTSSDVEIGGTRKKRKRKWKEFFDRLMKQVVEKQEELQRRFLEAVEKREHERMVREEAWRMQEMARINREREILAQERSMTAAKDAAVMAFLQKLSEKQNPGQPTQLPQPPSQPPQPPPTQQAAPPPPPPLQSQPVVTTFKTTKTDNGDQIFTPTSSSRWPKVEIEALIKLRTNLDSKYLENGPKGPLWEEISAGMKRLGYNRSAKRCKEKWENINKYFKKVKESSKKRPEDSKTCPYFHQLDALYKEKNKFNFVDHNMASSSSSGQIKPENTVPLMVRPEQQWPPPPPQMQPQGHHRRDLRMEDIEGENFAHNPNVHEEEDRDGDDDDEDDEDEEEEGEFEIVPNNNNKGVSLGTSG